MYGIDASAKPSETRDQVARIARFTAEAIGLGRDLREDEIIGGQPAINGYGSLFGQAAVRLARPTFVGPT